MNQPQLTIPSPLFQSALLPAILILAGCGRSASTDMGVEAPQASDAAKPTAKHIEAASASAETKVPQSSGPGTTPPITYVAQQAEPELSPRERKIHDARNANKTAARIRAVLAEVAGTEPTASELPLVNELKHQHEVYRLLEKDIIREQEHPERPGLLMPWDSRASDLSTFSAVVAGQRRLPTYNLALSAIIRADQLASVNRKIGEIQAQLTNLRARRAWAKLTEAEKTACQKYHPEFADEASGQNEKKLQALDQKLAGTNADSATLAERADLHWRRGNLSSALADFESCLKLDSKNHDVRLKYAQLCEVQGQRPRPENSRRFCVPTTEAE